METVDKRSVILEFYDAWVRRDWQDVERRLLTDDFHFRSPVDDFRGVETYHTKCWPVGEGSERFALDAYMEAGDNALLTYTWTARGSSFRAAEHIRFAGDRIASIDCFWGFLPKG